MQSRVFSRFFSFFTSLSRGMNIPSYIMGWMNHGNKKQVSKGNLFAEKCIHFFRSFIVTPAPGGVTIHAIILQPQKTTWSVVFILGVDGMTNSGRRPILSLYHLCSTLSIGPSVLCTVTKYTGAFMFMQALSHDYFLRKRYNKPIKNTGGKS